MTGDGETYRLKMLIKSAAEENEKSPETFSNLFTMFHSSPEISLWYMLNNRKYVIRSVFFFSTSPPGHNGSCCRLVVHKQSSVIYVMQHVITTPTSTEVNCPHYLPVSQFAPLFWVCQTLMAEIGIRSLRLPSPLSH